MDAKTFERVPTLRHLKTQYLLVVPAMLRNTMLNLRWLWGVTGTGLRATGIDFDVRKYRPYSGYENFDFDVPVEYEGDAYARVWFTSVKLLNR